MSAPMIVFLGCRLPALARIPAVGEPLGLSRSGSYRASNGWPLTGPQTSRRVIVPRLLDELGIRYTVEGSEDA